MKNFRYILISAAFLLTFLPSKADKGEIAAALASRVVPALSDMLVFNEIEAPADTFAVSRVGDKVRIKGSSPLAMCVGLNNYLRSVGISVSWFADTPVVVPANVELPSHPITGRAVVPERFFLNYCTFGYTMPFWKWKDWERFIDWMALNGINLPLAMAGQEKIWLETWKKFGLEEADILASFTGPAHLPWHWMANVDHYQGPLTNAWIDASEDLQKRILHRERELGMKPVLPAFAGHVPAAFKEKYPEADITTHKSWCGFQGDDRSSFLNPADSLYAAIQKTFIAIQDSIYGSDHIYGIDPFNEIDSPDWSPEFLNGVSRNIYNTLKAADTDARWLQMTWTFYNDSKHWTKPRIKAFLDGVPDEDLILLDYYCEVQPVWKITDAYFGKPYVLCYLGNFGANTMIIGNPHDIDDKINDFLENGGRGKVGIGGTLEGLDVNPYMHEFVLAKAWNPDLTPAEWTEKWAKARGGINCPSVVEGWKLLADKVYVSHAKNGQGGMTNLRPILSGTRLNTCDATIAYDNADLEQALRLLLAEGADIDNPGYRFDVMNVTRQILANQFITLRNEMADAYRNNNVDSVVIVGARMDNLLKDLDRLMATNPDYSLTKWVESARSFGTTNAERDSLEVNARSILTLWGYPGTVLNDYANRHWAGLIDTFYRPRWKMFTEALRESLESGQPFDEKEFHLRVIDFEESWAKSHTPTGTLTNENPVTLAKALLQSP